MINEKARSMLQAKRGEEVELGQEWKTRFMRRHPDLQTYRATPLDRIRANGLNPTVLKDYEDTVEELFTLHKPPERNIFGADEVPMNCGIAPRQKVVGKAGQRVQHHQTNGEKENITCIETICADGTVLRPTVIFKGKYRMDSWQENNPDGANVAISSRGYIDGELSVDWIKGFDEDTKDRVGARFLFVDGHSSHCTVEFLDYAAEHNIIVISYPPHTTHALQGLDVACFGPLKLYWSQEKAKWERLKKRRLGKNDFLEVYSLARRRAFTEKNIKSAFRTTGLVPFRRGIVQPDQMAPALVDSAKGGFPLPLPTPARALMSYHQELLANPEGKRISALDLGVEDSSPEISRARSGEPPLQPNSLQKNQLTLRDVLQKTSAGFLVSDSPLKPAARLPPIVIQPIPDNLKPDYSILARTIPLGKMTRAEVELENEKLRDELQKARGALEVLETVKEEAYAQLILREMHLDELSARLADLEEKKKTPQKRIMLMKVARFMSDCQFRDIRRQQQAAKDAKVAAQAAARVKAKVETDRAERRKAWRETEKAERGRKQAEALAKWQKKGKLRLPKKPAVTKLYPRAPTPPHLKSQKRSKAVEEEAEEVEEVEEIDIEVGSEEESDDKLAKIDGRGNSPEPRTPIGIQSDVELRVKHNGVLPIHSLPAELFLQVIHYDLHRFIEHDFSGYYPHVVGLSGVCSHWYNLIRDSPPIWTQIHSWDSPDIVGTALQRSSSHLLDIIIYELGGQEHIQQFLNTILSHRNRWRSLGALGSSSWMSLLTTALDEPAPNLQKIYLVDQVTTPSNDEFDLFGGATPQLKELSLNGVSARWDSTVVHGLKSIDLSWIHFPSTNTVLDILSHSPQLQRATIWRCTTGSIFKNASYSIQLSRLSFLQIDLGTSERSSLSIHLWAGENVGGFLRSRVAGWTSNWNVTPTFQLDQLRLEIDTNDLQMGIITPGHPEPLTFAINGFSVSGPELLVAYSFFVEMLVSWAKESSTMHLKLGNSPRVYLFYQVATQRLFVNEVSRLLLITSLEISGHQNSNLVDIVIREGASSVFRNVSALSFSELDPSVPSGTLEWISRTVRFIKTATDRSLDQVDRKPKLQKVELRFFFPVALNKVESVEVTVNELEGVVGPGTVFVINGY
ncbi:hypothetical protein FRC01_009737 [Tulasnella sp. 417]|nr:hypothetical protein FRC01_009737 [Tulasnella sp. 417]